MWGAAHIHDGCEGRSVVTDLKQETVILREVGPSNARSETRPTTDLQNGDVIRRARVSAARRC